MDNLKKGISKAMNKDVCGQNLHEVGKEWACFCLDTYNGNLLGRGLDISKAIACFISEIEHPTEY